MTIFFRVALFFSLTLFVNALDRLPIALRDFSGNDPFIKVTIPGILRARIVGDFSAIGVPNFHFEWKSIAYESIDEPSGNSIFVSSSDNYLLFPKTFRKGIGIGLAVRGIYKVFIDYVDGSTETFDLLTGEKFESEDSHGSDQLLGSISEQIVRFWLSAPESLNFESTIFYLPGISHCEILCDFSNYSGGSRFSSLSPTGEGVAFLASNNVIHWFYNNRLSDLYLSVTYNDKSTELYNFRTGEEMDTNSASLDSLYGSIQDQIKGWWYSEPKFNTVMYDDRFCLLNLPNVLNCYLVGDFSSYGLGVKVLKFMSSGYNNFYWVQGDFIKWKENWSNVSYRLIVETDNKTFITYDFLTGDTIDTLSYDVNPLFTTISDQIKGHWVEPSNFWWSSFGELHAPDSSQVHLVGDFSAYNGGVKIREFNIRIRNDTQFWVNAYPDVKIYLIVYYSNRSTEIYNFRTGEEMDTNSASLDSLYGSIQDQIKGWWFIDPEFPVSNYINTYIPDATSAYLIGDFSFYDLPGRSMDLLRSTNPFTFTIKSEVINWVTKYPKSLVKLLVTYADNTFSLYNFLTGDTLDVDNTSGSSLEVSLFDLTKNTPENIIGLQGNRSTYTLPKGNKLDMLIIDGSYNHDVPFAPSFRIPLSPGKKVIVQHREDLVSQWKTFLDFSRSSTIESVVLVDATGARSRYFRAITFD